MTEYLKELPGYKVHRSRRGFCIVTADYWAIPRPENWAREKQETLGMRKWRREYERDRTVGGESAFFPEFTPEVHVRKIAGLLPLTVYRGFDFGRRHPACVWLQYSPRSNRVWFLRELVLSDVDVYTFRDLVRYLSGQLSLGELQIRPKAIRHLDWLSEERDFLGERMPGHPWFENCQFVDFAGHEATIDRSGILETEHEHKTYADVFRDGGIQLSAHYMRVSARVILMRQLLGARKDGDAGAFFDPACRTLIRAMAGALAFKRGTRDNPAQEEPAKAPMYLDVFDAASYPLPSIVSIHEEVEEKTAMVNRAVLRGEDWREEPELAPNTESIDSGLLNLWK